MSFITFLPKVIRDCIGFASLRSVIGLENSRYSLNQSDSNYNQYKLGTRVSPRFKHFGCFNSESSWLLKAFLGLFRFGFNDSQSKSALREITQWQDIQFLRELFLAFLNQQKIDPEILFHLNYLSHQDKQDNSPQTDNSPRTLNFWVTH